MHEPTPTPWHIVPYGDGDSLVICSDEAGNHRIAFMAAPGSRETWKRIQANAALIVRAVNSHHAMLEALEELHGFMDAMQPSFKQHGRDIMDKARAAIRLGRG